MENYLEKNPKLALLIKFANFAAYFNHMINFILYLASGRTLRRELLNVLCRRSSPRFSSKKDKQLSDSSGKVSNQRSVNVTRIQETNIT